MPDNRVAACRSCACVCYTCCTAASGGCWTSALLRTVVRGLLCEDDRVSFCMRLCVHALMITCAHMLRFSQA